MTCELLPVQAPMLSLRLLSPRRSRKLVDSNGQDNLDTSRSCKSRPSIAAESCRCNDLLIARGPCSERVVNVDKLQGNTNDYHPILGSLQVEHGIHKWVVRCENTKNLMLGVAMLPCDEHVQLWRNQRAWVLSPSTRGREIFAAGQPQPSNLNFQVKGSVIPVIRVDVTILLDATQRTVRACFDGQDIVLSDDLPEGGPFSLVMGTNAEKACMTLLSYTDMSPVVVTLHVTSCGRGRFFVACMNLAGEDLATMEVLSTLGLNELTSLVAEETQIAESRLRLVLAGGKLLDAVSQGNISISECLVEMQEDECLGA